MNISLLTNAKPAGTGTTINAAAPPAAVFLTYGILFGSTIGILFLLTLDLASLWLLLTMPLLMAPGLMYPLTFLTLSLQPCNSVACHAIYAEISYIRKTTLSSPDRDIITTIIQD